MNVIDIQREEKNAKKSAMRTNAHSFDSYANNDSFHILYLLKVVVAVVVEVSFLPTFHAIDFGFLFETLFIL